MTDASLLLLPLLALTDSTSLGTLVIPALFLLAPGRIAVHRVLVYLGVVAALYCAIGLVLLGAAEAAEAALRSPQGERLGAALEALLGVALVAYGAWPKRWRGRPGAGGRLGAWRERAMTPGAPLGPLMLLATLAVALEVASMWPYIGAVALLARSEVPAVVEVLILVGYCVLMVAPAALLLVVRVLASTWAEGLLRRIESSMRRSSGSPAVRWASALVGVALIADAALRA